MVQVTFSHRDPDQIASKLSKVLESCSEWLVDNKLSLHLGKTECILFGSKRKLKKIKEFKVKCNDHVTNCTKQSYQIHQLPGTPNKDNR